MATALQLNGPLVDKPIDIVNLLPTTGIEVYVQARRLCGRQHISLDSAI